MSQSVKIEVFKNETFQMTFRYFDSSNLPILISSTAGSIKMQIRPLNDNTSTPVETINTVTTSVPQENGQPCFYLPFTSPDPQANTVILYIPQPQAEAYFDLLNVNQEYFYDIVVTRAGSDVKDRLVSGKFILRSGFTEI